MRAFWLIVLVPIGLVAYLGYRVAQDQESLERHQLQGLLEGRLADVKSRTAQAMGRLERRFLDRLAEPPADFEGLRQLTRDEPLARQVFLLGADGGLLFPVDGADASADERAFLERTRTIWTGQAVLYGGAGDDPANNPAAEPGPVPRVSAAGEGDSLIDLAARRPHGWVSWYWAEGLHLLFWRRAPDGRVVGLEVERIGLLAEVTASLPTTELEEGRMRLANSRGRTVHQWGPYERGDGEVAAASLPLDHPLDAWVLEYYISPAQRDAFAGGGVQLSLLLGLGAVAMVFLAMAVYTYREYARTLRDAAQRVTFVTQVSHELKTPLTNIRMYAELLGDKLDDDDDDNARRAGVIVAESERLTRLINNILTFSRERRGALETSIEAIDVNRAVDRVLEQFAPALTARGISAETQLGATRLALVDPDAFEQIVSNLLTNVEKYAASGAWVQLATEDRGDQVVVRVSDRGPGVPAGQREAVFRPFVRLSDRLADGVTGTGIGLAIARQLARASGGELTLIDSDDGAVFELALDAKPEGTTA